MKLHLNKNLSSANTLNKVLSPSKQFDVILKENTSLLFPVVTVTGKLYDFHEYNYAYIPSFGRYYFMSEPKSVGVNLVELSFSVDVLMSWKDQIKNCKAFITRQENKYNTFYYDEKFPEFCYNNTIIKRFPAKFLDQPNYILTLRGVSD